MASIRRGAECAQKGRRARLYGANYGGSPCAVSHRSTWPARLASQPQRIVRMGWDLVSPIPPSRCMRWNICGRCVSVVSRPELPSWIPGVCTQLRTVAVTSPDRPSSSKVQEPICPNVYTSHYRPAPTLPPFFWPLRILCPHFHAIEHPAPPFQTRPAAPPSFIRPDFRLGGGGG